jgi:hypothetical protein
MNSEDCLCVFLVPTTIIECHIITNVSISLLSGGVRQTMYDGLPRPLLSKSGFQGCIASLETNGELLV